MVTQPALTWILLSYRIPREPSTPRIAVWRKLKAVGALQIGDGLVALPKDARTKEHFEWVAELVHESDGEAIVWSAEPTMKRQSADLANQMRTERDVEYAALLSEVESDQKPDSRTVQRWRREWRRIDRRDYLRAPLRDTARLAIDAASKASTSSSKASKEMTS